LAIRRALTPERALCDQLCEVGQRSGQPIDLVNDDDVDLPASDNVQKLLHGRLRKKVREGLVRQARKNPVPGADKFDFGADERLWNFSLIAHLECPLPNEK
jgi:hypothetical protein